MLWGGSFIHSKMYARALAYLRGIRYWTAFQDLVYLVDQLEHLCPPVGMEMSRPDFWQFVRNSDYHLYRAMVHILDGKTLIADFLDDTIPVDQAARQVGSRQLPGSHAAECYPARDQSR